MPDYSISVIIPCGGTGERMGGKEKKQFLRLNGNTVLNHAMAPFLSCQRLKQMVVCLPPEDLKHPSLIRRDAVTYTAGGASRAASVHKGFCALKGLSATDIVLIHDGVRPFPTPDLIERVILKTAQEGAVVPVVPVTDTLKRVRDEVVVRTLERSEVVAVQTPQGFHYGILHEAYEKDDFTKRRFTDEAMLVEELGRPVHTVVGDERNIKITTPFDLEVARVIVGGR